VKLVVGGLVVVGIAAGTFFVARALDGRGASGAIADAGPSAPTPPVVLPPMVAPPPVVDAGAAEVADAGVDATADAGAAVEPPTKPTVKPPRALAPPPPADKAVLDELEAQVRRGEWDAVWSRRSSTRYAFASPEARRDFAVLLTEVACQRGDLSAANMYFRQLSAPAAKELARKRCAKHRADFALE
jgi:hypothetical protein